MKAVLIMQDGSIDLIDQDWTYYKITEAVGGIIEAVGFGDNEYFAYVNEEGKLYGLPENKVATEIWYESGARILIGDYIAGNALFFGEVDENGNNTDIPPNVWVIAYNVQQRMIREGKINPGTIWPEDDEEEEEFIGCEMCDGLATPMGRLGNRQWFNCISCGWQISIRKENSNVS